MTTPNENSAAENAGRARPLAIKIFGVGGAGGNLVEHLPRENMGGVACFALNTDARALMHCQVAEKLVLGTKTTRGLGAGGDPETGRLAAKDDLEKCKLLCAGADLVFIVVGLGGGTGTGASPILAQAARAAGALVLAVATLPFDFEGSRRQRQAQIGLRDLKAASDAVICLPNQKIFKLIDGKTTFLDTFKLTNELVASSLLGIWRMLTQPGLIHVDFGDLCSVTRGRQMEGGFATVETKGRKRAAIAAEKLLEHPLFEDNAMAQADGLLVSVVGGADLTMSEVDELMQALKAKNKNARIFFGATVDEKFADRLLVTVILARENVTEEEASEMAPASRLAIPSEADTDFQNNPAPRPASRFVTPVPELSEETKQQMAAQKGRPSRSRKKAATQQGQLPLEIVSRGRFEKSEPTIYQGQDLDVPTYIRRGISLN